MPIACAGGSSHENHDRRAGKPRHASPGPRGGTFVVLAFAGSLLNAGPAAAGYNPDYPFCVASPYFPLDCTQTNRAMCEFSANGLGKCVANPFYVGPPAAGHATRRRRHHRG